MNRRALLLGSLSVAPFRALAQPLPVVSDTVPVRRGPGPLSSLTAGPPGKALDLSFMTPGVLDPRITFTRASTATYFDATGTMRTAATNAPRWDYNPGTLVLQGLLLEEARTNSVRNSTMQGAVPGSPGTLPTNWLLGGSPAVTPQVIGTGTENGIPYIDLRLVGTTSNAQFTLLWESTTAIAAANGQAWSNSAYIRLVAGTLTNFGTIQLLTNETTAAGAAVKVNFGPLFTPTTAPLATQRQTYAVTLSGGGTVGAVHPRLQIVVTNGVAIDATFRIGAPQVEQGAFPTSYIPTTAAAVTRSADGCNIPPANMGWFGGKNTSSWFAEFIPFAPTVATGQRVVGSLGQSGAPDRTTLARSPTLALQQYDSVLALVTANTIAAGVVSKGASTWAAGAAGICLNGGAIATSAALTGGYGTFSTTGVFFLQGSSAAAENMTGYIRRVSYWQRVLTNAELQQVTT